MYNLDSFSYWKDPLVRIKRIGIYPLDDEGKTQYYSKESFVHHYLRKQIPPELLDDEPLINSQKTNDNEFKLENEEQKRTINPEEIKNIPKISNLTIPHNDTKEIIRLHTESNERHPIQIQEPINNIGYQTISTTEKNDFFNKRYFNILEKNKKLKLKQLNDLRGKSYQSRNKDFKKELFSQKPIIPKRKMVQSFDKIKNKKNKINYKLPKIMGGFGNQTFNRIEVIRTGTKDMGENYNPYNFIIPHVNRTKRNIFGSLFHG